MRYLSPHILDDLKKKMAFIGGPRQCGKTTLAKSLLDVFSGEYLNWDDARDRKRIKNYEFSKSRKLVIFDELHKLPRWKTWIKGLFDTKPPGQTYLVTGSARLDVYRRGGDSLLGRYHYWRLHPFTLDEYVGGFEPSECLRRLMTVGGFPEPFLQNDPREAQRWRRERFDRVLRDDIRDLENVRMLTTLEMLVDLLRERVGSSIVVSNLAEDLQVASQTVSHWIEILDRMYLTFTIKPYTAKIARAVQRPPRVYFFDNMDVLGPDDKILGSRFENLVATHLLKRINYLEDYTGHKYELHYLRDKDQREVDFVITKDRKIDELIEVKYSDEQPTKGIIYYAAKLKPRVATQIVHNCRRPFEKNGVQVVGPTDYFKVGPWVSRMSSFG